MADLISRKRAEPTKIVGADPVTGSEDNYVGVTDNNDMMVTDTANTLGANGALAVSTTAMELRVGATAIVDRKFITIQPKGTGMFWGYSNGVTTLNGSELFKKQTMIIPVGFNVKVWLIASTGTVDVRIGELS